MIRDAVSYMPNEAPLEMVHQNLDRPFTDPAAPGSRDGAGTWSARVAVFACASLTTAGITATFVDWFDADGLSAPEWGLIIVVALTFFWVALGVAQATVGLFARGRPVAPEAANPLDVAVLFPMYNEPPAQTFGAIRALRTDLAMHGRHRASIHVISDTRDAQVARAEEEAFAALIHEKGPAIHYRRRARNERRKVGNVEDWVTRWGGGYEAFVVADADSILSAATVDRLADELADDDGAALIQTVPRLVLARSVFGRAQAFANNIYGPLLARGLTAWTGSAGNFWGHNAIVRTRAFARCCGLPDLPGRSTFAGTVRSHDFVEAALLRRAGWGVRVVPGLDESYEEVPQTIVDFVLRDRRWAHGNLQHIALLGVPGLHPASRFHMVQGAMAYLASFGWLALIVLWIVQGAAAAGVSFNYFDSANPLFPRWPEMDTVSKAVVLGFVAAMLLGPKLMALTLAARRQPSLRAFGGWWRFMGSGLAEIALAAILAPIMMVQHVQAVLRAVAGFDAGWAPQNRAGSAYGLNVLLRFHAVETLAGVVLCALVATGTVSPWLAPVAVPLLLAVPLSWLTSWHTRAFATAEDVTPPQVVRATVVARADLAEGLITTDRRERVGAPVGRPIEA